MTGGAAVALVCTFAAGVLVAQTATDHQRGAAPCRAPQGGAVFDPAPALHHHRPRESWVLTHPLECPGAWVKNCPDFKACQPVCLARGVDDPGALRLEPERDLKHIR